MESEKPLGRQHAFRVRVESDGELYVRVSKGVQAFGGFPLSEDYNAVVNVPALPREVQIEGQGGSPLFYLVKVDNARFSAVVAPGDQLRLEVSLKRLLRGMGLFEARALVDGKTVASCELMCAARSDK
jgi:hypothetical protein